MSGLFWSEAARPRPSHIANDCGCKVRAAGRKVDLSGFMAGLCRDLGAQEVALQEGIADAMEARCQDIAQISIRQAYLGGIKPGAGAVAVELESGTVHVTRDLLTMAGATTAHGIEPPRVMVERARPFC
ncbi:MAG: hypothetical protein GKR98_04310 [Boseongicola sp.]|nr:MAG: hypothetical protein GKR98_04310 [Boseongicola sp.]